MSGAPALATLPVTENHPPARWTILHQFPGADTEAKWREFLDQADCPSAYETPEFFLEPYWDSSHPFAILAFDGTDMVGVLTGIHARDRVISGLPSRPQVCMRRDGYGSPANI